MIPPHTKNPDFASPAFRAEPFGFYARLRATAPVYRAALPGRQTAWLVTRYDDVLATLKDERLVKDPRAALAAEQREQRPWLPAFLAPLSRNMLDLDGADHARLRALVQQAFTPRLVERLRGRVQALADELLDRAAPGGRLDLIRDYALPLPLTVIGDLLGVPPTERAQFGRWSRRIVAVTGSPRDLPVALPAIWQFMRFVRRLCAIRRADPQDDLLTALLRAEEGGDRLSEDELLAMVVLLLIAGHETTVNLIGSGTLALLDHPDQLARLRADPALIRPAIEELLRFTSPVADDRRDGDRARRADPGGPRLGQPRRAAVRPPGPPRPRAHAESAPRVRAGGPLLPRRTPRPPGGAARDRDPPAPRAEPTPRRRSRRAALAARALPARPGAAPARRVTGDIAR